MIFTCTMNPSLDYFMEFDAPAKEDGSNRSQLEYYEAGGKGINVSIVLNNLGIPTRALGFVGGFTKDFYISLLAKYEDGKPRRGLSTMDIDVCRNAYGRQLGSFHATGRMAGVADNLPMTFIRAPYVRKTTDGSVEILSEVDGRIVAARQGNQLATAFHPELTDDTRVHQYFVDMIMSRND